MKSWKQAVQLIHFELNYSKQYYLLQAVVLFVLLYLIIPIVPEYFERSFLGLDFLFFCAVLIFSQLTIPKIFKSKMIDNGYWASHFIILLNQLAVRREAIVKYRLLMYSIITLSFTSLFLLLLYLLSPYIQQNIPVSTYTVFATFWLCFSCYIGYFQPVLEAGYRMYLTAVIMLVIVGPALIIIITYLFYIIYPVGGFVNWTIMISTKWPLLTIVFSLLLTVISFIFNMKRMQRNMMRTDYLS